MYHMYVCVSLCPYHGRVGNIPVSPILYHMYVCILMSIPSQRTMGEWDTSQSVPFMHIQLPHCEQQYELRLGP